MEQENKVQFNLKNVHYAVMTDEGAGEWSTPVAIPGAVTLTLDPQGDVTPFYADGIVYYNSVSNQGYSGDLEMARYPDKMLKDVWGLAEDATDFTLTENANIEPKNFALMYQIDGDADEQLYVLYKCVGTRPGIGGTTNTNTKEPQTQSSTISATPMLSGNVMARTTAKTPEPVRTNWFQSVYQKNQVV